MEQIKVFKRINGSEIEKDVNDFLKELDRESFVTRVFQTEEVFGITITVWFESSKKH